VTPRRKPTELFRGNAVLRRSRRHVDFGLGTPGRVKSGANLPDTFSSSP
jgi:hypothetical protein